MALDEPTDFEELSARIRTQSEDASGSDTERVAYRSLDEVSVDALRTLREALDPGTSEEPVFVVSMANAELLLETTEGDEIEDLEDRLGREIRVAERMPDDTLLLLAPNAVDGAEVVDPSGIVCGMVGSAGKAEGSA